ncbi:MAG: hypothetical protein U0787_14880 [Polyangia bacterium]
MDLKPCSWQQVVEALRRCGSVSVMDRDDHVAVGKFPHIFTLSKAAPVPTEIQEKILNKFGITRVEYLSNLPEPPLLN